MLYMNVVISEIAPTFTSQPQDTTVIEGQSARIHCQADGAPKPSITWLKGKMRRCVDLKWNFSEHCFLTAKDEHFAMLEGFKPTT